MERRTKIFIESVISLTSYFCNLNKLHGVFYVVYLYIINDTSEVSARLNYWLATNKATKYQLFKEYSGNFNKFVVIYLRPDIFMKIPQSLSCLVTEKNEDC